MASDISCCGSFIECSNAGRCVKLNDPLYDKLYKDCSYAKQLEKGLNFYTQFNANNRMRALEYAQKLKSQKMQQNENGIADTYSSFSNGAYITINGRQFYIGRKSGKNGYTYNLSDNEINKLKQDLGSLPLMVGTEFCQDEYIDESGTENDRAEWKVSVIIGNNEYNILNCGFRYLRESTAKKLCGYLAGLELKAVCEFFGSNKKNSVYPQVIQSQRISEIKPKAINANEKTRADIYAQLSIFDLC